jgi:hypothetical protein
MHRMPLVAVCALFSITTATTSLSAREQQCESPANLSNHPGHYARKSVWDQLQLLKSWSDSNRFKGWISAIDIKSDGDNFASLRWHEGQPVCIKFQGNAVWASSEDSPSSAWEGPFIKVGPPIMHNHSALYFDRLFKHNCFTSNTNEAWCFETNSIKINNRAHKAELVLDSVEIPNYGSPVSVENSKHLWMFVATSTGWDVFLDSSLTTEGRLDVDPKKSTPWRTLSAK